MTKNELVEKLAHDTGLAKTSAKLVLETILARITKVLKKDGHFAWTGLGSFEVVKRARRKGRNPRTGDPVTIKASKAVRFKASKTLKDAVNG